MHEAHLLQDLAVVMIVAGIVTVLFHRFNQPVVLGYILAGVIIGPYAPPFPLISDVSTINTLSELGVIFLMFSLGLEFSFRKLRQVGVSAFIAAALEIILMVWVGFEIGVLFGWSNMDSIFLGGILAISSTTIIVKALEELGLNKERFAELIFGVLIFEDILGILIIAVLSGVAQTGTFQLNAALEAAGRLAVFLVVTLVMGILIVPKLLAMVGRYKRSEMLLITVLGLCFAACVATLKLGYSVALGAFMMGAVIAEAREIGRIEELMEPIRDMFSAVFFVSIGLLIDPKLLLEYAVPIIVITLAVVIGKVLTCSFGVIASGQDLRTSMRVGMGLAQIGEFSFIIAGLGTSLGVTSNFLYPIAVTVSAITTLITPYLIRSSDPVVNWFLKSAPKPIIGLLRVYTDWLNRVGGPSRTSAGRKLLRRWLLMMVVNMLFVAGIFITAAFLAKARPPFLIGVISNDQTLAAVLWFCSILIAFPFLIATYKKLQAFGMLVADLKVYRAPSREHRINIQLILSNSILVAGTIVMGVIVVVLSSALLRGGSTFLLLLVVAFGITALLRKTYVRLYSKAQFAVQEAFALPAHQEPNRRGLKNLLHEAELEKVPIGTDSRAAGKLIRELELRSQTGATIVAIQRDGRNILNPDPNEELLPGDAVLLLGSADQLGQASRFLQSPQ